MKTSLIQVQKLHTDTPLSSIMIDWVTEAMQAGNVIETLSVAPLIDQNREFITEHDISSICIVKCEQLPLLSYMRGMRVLYSEIKTIVLSTADDMHYMICTQDMIDNNLL